MQLEKITLISLFITILLICSLSTISAANDTINSTSTGGIAQGITNTGTGDTLFLQPGTYNKTGQDTNINVNKNITIQGNGSTNSVIIDAQKISRIFTIANNTNVTFINITFTNGNVSSIGGGAIFNNYSDTKISFIDCIFTNNYANAGGAILNNGNMSVTNSTFTNNRGIQGGAILSTNAALILSSNFTNNTVTQFGGAIYNIRGNMTIYNSIFSNCESPEGGAIRSAESPAILTIYNSTFNNNNATNGGGAVRNVRGNMTIYNSTFNNNKAGFGGAVSSTGVVNYLTIIGSTFNNNNATNGGGGAINCNEGNATITSSTFNNNNATNGGAIYNNIVNNMTVSDNTMSNNIASLGQMIYNAGTMGVLNLTFIDNSTWVIKNGSTITLYATLVDDMGNTVTGQNISFYLNGVLYENVTAIEGKANMTYTTSSTGDIPVSGLYEGNGACAILINNGLLQVRIPTKITISVPKEVKVGDKITLESKLTDENGDPIAGTTVDFYVDGKKVGSAVTDVDGIAKLNYTFTKAGNPNVEAKFAGDNTYMASNATNSTTVSKIPTKITVETNEDTITATLTDEDGNPLANKEITITINGKTYTKTTNSKGQIVMKYKNAWDYKVTANFAGNEQYTASKATAPKRTPTKITIKTEGDKITATLTDKNGKPITGKKLTFRVKGVIIGVGITDANGQVVIYYKNANKKAVTVSFEGDNEYAPSSATSTPESDNVQVSGKVAMKNTGIPIIAVLLALITSMGLVTLRKRK